MLFLGFCAVHLIHENYLLKQYNVNDRAKSLRFKEAKSLKLSKNRLLERVLRLENSQTTSKKRAEAHFDIGFSKFGKCHRTRCRFSMGYDPVDEQKSKHQNRRLPKIRFSLKCKISYSYDQKFKFGIKKYQNSLFCQ